MPSVLTGFPLEGSDVTRVMEREASGTGSGTACTSEWFMNLFFAARNIALHGEQRLNLVEPDFFQLGFVLDWLRPRRDDIRQRLAAFDGELSGVLARLRQAYEVNPLEFERLLPAPQFDPRAAGNLRLEWPAPDADARGKGVPLQER